MPNKKPKESILDRISKLEDKAENLEDKAKDFDEEEFSYLKERIQDLERAVYGRTDEEFDAAQDNDDSVLEEDPPKKEGWVIMAPCPPKLKGIEQYYTENGEEAFTDQLEYAEVFKTKKTAERKAMTIWHDEQTYVPFYKEYRKAGKKMPLLVCRY